jgi:hypothetical protein
MSRVLARFAFLALVLSLAVSAVAKPKSEHLTLFHDATINGTNLPAGDYTLKYDVNGNNAQVKFMQGSKEVATAEGQVKTLPNKVNSSQVVLNNDSRSISEIDFGGKDTAITFGSPSTSAGK